MDYRTNELRNALIIYQHHMREIHDKRLILDAEEIDAYHDLLSTLNADNPAQLHPVFRPHFPAD